VSEMDAEDRDILRAWSAAGLLDHQERDEVEALTRPGDEPSEARVRLNLESLGLLPYALEAPAPPPALRARILATVAGDETMAVVGEMRRPPSGAPVAPAQPAPEARAPRVRVPVVARRSRWPMALAATLAFLALGLSGFLFMQLEEQRSQTVRLQAQMRQLHTRQSELETMQTELAALRRNVGFMTAPGALSCALSPAGPAAPQPGARGILFVAADHQHWYLSLRGLAPAPSGQAYQLWWEADAGLVSGGTFEARAGESVELSSATMPRGTHAVRVTLEPKAGSPQPRGPQVLAGSEMQRLL